MTYPVNAERRPPWRRSFWLWHLLLPLTLFVPLALLGQFSEVDIWVSDRLYDFANRDWLVGNTWLTQKLLHDFAARLMKILAGLMLLALALVSWRPGWQRWRRPLAYACLSMGLGSGLVALGKQVSNVDCPWHIDRYGGHRPYVHVFSPAPPGKPRGVCFPGGHSSGGFSLFFLYFLLLRVNRRRALAGLAVALGLGLGLLFAVNQWLRGAHFLSHDVWTAFICWIVALSLYAGPFRGRL